MVDNRVNGNFSIKVVPPRIGLAIHHDHHFIRNELDFLNGDQVQAKAFHHGLVFSPTDDPIAGQPGGNVPFFLNKVG